MQPATMSMSGNVKWRMDAMKALLASALALALLGSPAWPQTVEYGKDRPGSDLTNFNLPANSVPENCQGACEANTSCQAWTFVRGATPQCWLKNAKPVSTDAACCVSGVKP
jgi:hypothetical protein